MAADELAPSVKRLLTGLSRLQADFGREIADVREESPAAALDSLVAAIAVAPSDYRPYLQEALECYRHGLYRPSILMVWSAVVQHLYSLAASHHGGLKLLEKANKTRFGSSRKYREIKKQGDLLYIGERDFIQLGEDAGMFNRNARKLLQERLDLRNLCGHPTLYTPGREETVVFVEGLLLNVLSGTWLEW
jgi:hypothetical protein